LTGVSLESFLPQCATSIHCIALPRRCASATGSLFEQRGEEPHLSPTGVAYPITAYISIRPRQDIAPVLPYQLS